MEINFNFSTNIWKQLAAKIQIFIYIYNIDLFLDNMCFALDSFYNNNLLRINQCSSSKTTDYENHMIEHKIRMENQV